MANYNVDDILAELESKKAGKPYEPASKKADEPAPFSMSGMTGEFEAARPVPEKRTTSPSMDATRVDMPAVKSSTAVKDDMSSTRVMSAITAEQEELSKRRQDQVSRFKLDRSAIEDDYDEDDGDDDDKSGGLDLSSFFSRKKKPSASKKFFSRDYDDDDYEEDDDEDDDIIMSFGKEDDDKFEEKRPKKPLFNLKKKEKTPRIEEDDDDDDEELLEDAHEYTDRSEIPSVKDELSSLSTSLVIRLIVTGVCFAFTLYVSLCNIYPLPFIPALCPENNMTAYLVTCFVPLIFACIASYPVLGNGIITLFTGKAGHDTPAALCALAVIGHTIALIASGSFEIKSGALYPAVAALTLFMNAVGKLMMIRRIERNFSVASSESELIAEMMMPDEDLAETLMEGQGFEEAEVVCAAGAGFPEKFLAISYSPDYSDMFCRIASPLLLGFGAMSSLIAWFVFKQGPTGGLTVFCVMMCIASALTETLVGNLPLYRASKTLSKEGAFVAGYASIEEFDEMNAVALDANELYPSGAAVLHGIKAFAQSRIDEAILDAASVMCSVDGVLKDVFLDTIGQKTDILKPVTSIRYEEQKGICAKVNGRNVLIGNRDLMQAHGISMPSRDYEAKFIKGDRDILYLANSGEVTAMFVLSYRVSRSVARWISSLAKRDLSLIVHSTDPNITARKIAKDYGFPEEYIKVVPADMRERYLAATSGRESVPAFAMSIAGRRTRLRLLAALPTLRQSVRLGTILQIAGLILGYAIVAFLAFFGSIGTMGFIQVLIYQAFWAVIVLLLPLTQKF